MQNYNPKSLYGEYVVRVHFQHEDYKGSVDTVINGSFKGKDVIEAAMDCVTDDFCEGDTFVKNDIGLKIEQSGWTEDSYVIHATLKNDAGDILEIEDDAETLPRMVVGAEIISYKPKDTWQE